MTTLNLITLHITQEAATLMGYKFIVASFLLWKPSVMHIAWTLYFKTTRAVSSVFSFDFTRLIKVHNISLRLLSSFFVDDSLLPVTRPQFLHLRDTLFWKTAYISSIREADVCFCENIRGYMCTWLGCMWLKADWSQAEEGEDDEGNNDEGQLKASEWQFHLHNYTIQKQHTLMHRN